MEKTLIVAANKTKSGKNKILQYKKQILRLGLMQNQHPRCFVIVDESLIKLENIFICWHDIARSGIDEFRSDQSAPIKNDLVPLSQWGRKVRDFHFSNIESYKNVVADIERIHQDVLAAHSYNSLESFLKFHEDYGSNRQKDVSEFFRTYIPKINRHYLSCVGLAMVLINKLQVLDKKYPGIGRLFHLISSDDRAIESGAWRGDIDTPDPWKSEKTHVIVGLNIKIGTRCGIILLDSGYHISHPITVMRDLLHPNTGWFTQHKNHHFFRNYNYSFARNGNYIEWNIRERRKDIVNGSCSVIYVGGSFLTPIRVTERRCLVHNHKTIASRDINGNVVSGIVVDLEAGSESFTLLYMKDDVQLRWKTDFKSFILSFMFCGEFRKVLALCARQMHMVDVKALVYIVLRLHGAFLDTQFINGVASINHAICPFYNYDY